MKTEEGYSADIYPWRYTYVRTMSAQHHLMKDLCLTRDIPREMLCGHRAYIVRTYISPGIFFGFQLSTLNEQLNFTVEPKQSNILVILISKTMFLLMFDISNHF